VAEEAENPVASSVFGEGADRLSVATQVLERVAPGSMYQGGEVCEWKCSCGTLSPYLVLLGTGYGLTPEVIQEADGVLQAIGGRNGYNHLSVRCAAAIIVDRLLAEERADVD
jgi:hypothetical protein